ncbi:UNVERIFIED_CONTAM: ATPase, AAA family protein [Hammondia hammondi]|eukprot:XP_008888107.1 ATPase, AAA family protein [Hammondia hammondi]
MPKSLAVGDHVKTEATHAVHLELNYALATSLYEGLQDLYAPRDTKENPTVSSGDSTSYLNKNITGGDSDAEWKASDGATRFVQSTLYKKRRERLEPCGVEGSDPISFRFRNQAPVASVVIDPVETLYLEETNVTADSFGEDYSGMEEDCHAGNGPQAQDFASARTSCVLAFVFTRSDNPRWCTPEAVSLLATSSFAGNTADVCVAGCEVHGPSGSGRSALCRTAGYFLSKTTGLFVLMVRCKLLAAEAVRFPIIKDLLVTVGVACALHAPSLLILDDLDALCGVVDTHNQTGPSLMDARSIQLSDFLADLLPSLAADVFINGRARSYCGMDHQIVSSLGQRRSPPDHLDANKTVYPLPAFVVIATSQSPTTLNQSLRTSKLFGGERIQLRNPATSRERVEILRHLLRLQLQRHRRTQEDETAKGRLWNMVYTEHCGGPLKASRRKWNSPSAPRSPIRRPLQIHADVWESTAAISQKMEGFSLADFKALIRQAIVEAQYESSIELNGRSTRAELEALGHEVLLWRAPRPNSTLQTSPFPEKRNPRNGVLLRRRHIDRACRDFTPRALQLKGFLKTDLTLQNVGGLNKVKEDLLDMLKMESTYGLVLRRAGVSIHRGVLLIGPPGCGKTFIAKAVVGDQEMRCLEVKGPELLSKYIGSSEAAVREVFTKARQAKPCIVIFDEVDALATKRGADSSGVTDRVVNQLLCYLDGVEERQEVYVIATTSRPDLVDPALLRPGRLEKVCYCGLPTTRSQRLEILKVSTNITTLAGDVSLEELEKTIPWEFSPADIHAAVKSAQLAAVHELLGTTSVDRLQDALRMSSCEERKTEAASDETKTNVDLSTEQSNCFGSFERRLEASQPDPSSKRVPVSQRHLLLAVAATKPSMTPGEIHRYHRLYAPFLPPNYIEDIRTLESILSASTTHRDRSSTTRIDKTPSPPSEQTPPSASSGTGAGRCRMIEAFGLRIRAAASRSRSAPASSIVSAGGLRSGSLELVRSCSRRSFSLRSCRRRSGSFPPVLTAETVKSESPQDYGVIEAKCSSGNPSDALFKSAAAARQKCAASLTELFSGKSSYKRSSTGRERHSNKAELVKMGAHSRRFLVQRHKLENTSSSSRSPKSVNSQKNDSRSPPTSRTASGAGSTGNTLGREIGISALWGAGGPSLQMMDDGKATETREGPFSSTEVKQDTRHTTQKKRRQKRCCTALSRVALA